MQHRPAVQHWSCICDLHVTITRAYTVRATPAKIQSITPCQEHQQQTQQQHCIAEGNGRMQAHLQHMHAQRAATNLSKESCSKNLPQSQDRTQTCTEQGPADMEQWRMHQLQSEHQSQQLKKGTTSCPVMQDVGNVSLTMSSLAIDSVSQCKQAHLLKMISTEEVAHIVVPNGILPIHQAEMHLPISFL